MKGGNRFLRKREMKKTVVFLLWIFLSLAGCKESESQKIRKLQLPAIDLSKIEDGRYRGRFTHHGNMYETEVLMENHRIEGIQVLQSEGDEYDQAALTVIPMVVEEQSLQVDAVSGATKSSKLYLITIYNALSGEEIDIGKLQQQ
jgi:uncharacterized protein with FMN-binding domain